ncbi:MalY/PatB family protein [Kosmotoga pacifica]|uniref:cysteine-S-conjugate beta-lyase n=1 Tax=Kosmotoga pacifica TaxID=1330330 RepID=A0A0G2ZAW7_9BACT|nr:MalY/PatB family protein [Kosmotoga pacifica]AKI96724.1 cystathionine beta-lyase [Kosmotoga pacifica]
MKYNFDEIIDRRGTESYKWDHTKDFFGRDDLLPMWVADMDFKSPPVVIEAILRRAEHGIFGYTAKSESFYQAFIDWTGKRHGWEVKKEWIIASPGVVPAIAIAIQAFTNPGDKIVVQTPVYYPFFNVVKNNRRELIINELIYNNGHYTMNYEDLIEKIDSKTKMLILCSPHNPVGRVWSKAELKRLGEICLEKGIIVVSDEIHSDIVYSESKHIPFASISEESANNSITCMAASKTFNIAGLETSLTIIPNTELRGKFKKILLKGLSLTLGNIFGTIATETAYRLGEDWLEELLDYLEKNRDFAIEYIRNNIPSVKAIKPEGTFLLWLDFRGLGLSDLELQKLILNEAGVALNHGTVFGKGGEGFQRLNFACPRAILEKGLKKIERAVKGLKDD